MVGALAWSKVTNTAQHNTMYQRFRWTPKNAPILLLWGFGVPSLIYMGISSTNVRLRVATMVLTLQNLWDYTGKNKDESLLRVSPEAESA